MTTSASDFKDSLANTLEYLKTLGIELIPFNREDIRTVSIFQSHSSEIEIVSGSVSSAPEDKKKALDKLKEDIGACGLCRLAENRTNIVFGEGNPNAKIMFIGEAPGREEDIQARPFVGEAGQHLTRLIEKILKLRREDVYIANICKCRPPGNRDPERDEIEACFPFLRAQIDIIRPELIISLGKISTYSLMKPDYPIAKFSILKERGALFYYCGIPVMPTTHPAYWLRNRDDKHKVVEDIESGLKTLRDLGKDIS